MASGCRECSCHRVVGCDRNGEVGLSVARRIASLAAVERVGASSARQEVIAVQPGQGVVLRVIDDGYKERCTSGIRTDEIWKQARASYGVVKIRPDDVPKVEQTVALSEAPDLLSAAQIDPHSACRQAIVDNVAIICPCKEQEIVWKHEPLRAGVGFIIAEGIGEVFSLCSSDEARRHALLRPSFVKVPEAPRSRHSEVTGNGAPLGPQHCQRPG